MPKELVKNASDAQKIVCELGLRAEGMEGEPLRDDIPLQQGGVVTFLNDASKDGVLLLI